MIDIHMHVVPGVDDGSQSIEESLEMIRMAYEQGTEKIIATPHSFAFSWTPGYPRERYLELKEAVRKAGIPVEILFGAEIYCDRGSMDDVLECLRSGIYPTMNDTKYVLEEFSTRITEEDQIYCTKRLLDAGYIPIIAHAERYKSTNARTAAYLRSLGAKIQINVYSVSQERDPVIRETANSLLQERLVDYVGSDAHRVKHRPPCEAPGIRYMHEHYDERYIRSVLAENAMNDLIGHLA